MVLRRDLEDICCVIWTYQFYLFTVFLVNFYWFHSSFSNLKNLVWDDLNFKMLHKLHFSKFVWNLQFFSTSEIWICHNFDNFSSFQFFAVKFGTSTFPWIELFFCPDSVSKCHANGRWKGYTRTLTLWYEWLYPFQSPFIWHLFTESWQKKSSIQGNFEVPNFPEKIETMKICQNCEKFRHRK